MARQRLRVFVSSPGDVMAAREVAAQVIEKLAHEYARFFTVEPYLWEYEPIAGKQPRGEIAHTATKCANLYKTIADGKHGARRAHQGECVRRSQRDGICRQQTRLRGGAIGSRPRRGPLQAGLIFALRRNRFVGSYCFFTVARRVKFTP